MERRLYAALILSMAVLAAAQVQGAYKTVYRFAGGTSDGAKPEECGLVSDGGFLYGMTPLGGTASRGIIFKIGLDGKGMTVLHNFEGNTSLDGQHPIGTLLFEGGKLYGMTKEGGGSDKGQIFSCDPSSGNYSSLLNFDGNAANGQQPCGGLVSDGAALYGMTGGGGGADKGTVFSIGKDGVGFNILHSFSNDPSDGQQPELNDLLCEGGVLYGTTSRGGSVNSQGTIFAIGTDGSGMAILHRFKGAAQNDGEKPYGGLVSDGAMLYGMTGGGGSDDKGTVFTIGKDGKNYRILHHFSSTNSQNGLYPTGGLLLDGNTLYGTAHWGGIPDPGMGFGYGVLFSIGTDGSNFTVLHQFGAAGTDGTDPRGSVISAGGVLYGMTYSGGANNLGTIFSYPLPRQGLNYINLDASPPSFPGGDAVAMGWECDFANWNYRGVPVNVYIAAIKDPKAVDAPSSVTDALAGGEVYLAADGMARWYRYTGSVGAPTWSNVSFPPVATLGFQGITTPTDAAFRGNWVFAAAFIYSNGSGFVRTDATPVENSNLFRIQ